MRHLSIVLMVLGGCGGSESERPRADELPAQTATKDGSIAIPSGEDGGTSAGASCRISAPCDSEAALQVRGTSPFGTVSFETLGVSYVDGDEPATHLAFAGQTDGLAFTFLVQLRPDLDGDELIPQAPPGFYEADEAAIVRPLEDGSCTLTQLHAEAIVTEHMATRTPSAGGDIRFNGALTVAGSGWDFRVDFQSQRACGTSPDR